MKKDYPVGSSWVAENKHKKGIAWLKEKHPKLQIWYYSSCFKDGSGMETNWVTSKDKAVSLCKIGMNTFTYGDVRFKKLEEKK